MVLKLFKEARSYQGSTRSSMLNSVFSQLPFFSCPDFFIDHDLQKDITKYIYCKDTNTPPYKGSYGEMPQVWKEKHFIIKDALAILLQDKREQIRHKHNGNR